jgi:hypothetical protein
VLVDDTGCLDELVQRLVVVPRPERPVAVAVLARCDEQVAGLVDRAAVLGEEAAYPVLLGVDEVDSFRVDDDPIRAAVDLRLLVAQPRHAGLRPGLVAGRRAAAGGTLLTERHAGRREPGRRTVGGCEISGLKIGIGRYGRARPPVPAPAILAVIDL